MIKVVGTGEITEIWRSARLEMLAEPQELYLENLVKAGVKFWLTSEGRRLGYAVTDGKAHLLELGLAKRVLTDLPAILAAIAAQCGVDHILAQSFDPILMSAGLLSKHVPKKRALLFRVVFDKGFESLPDIVYTPGSAEYVTELAIIGEDFFHSVAEIEFYLTHGGLWIYRSISGEESSNLR